MGEAEQHAPTVLVVVGTRPEAIKMIPVIRAFQAAERITPVVISTGQHAELVRQVLAVADIRADVELVSNPKGRSLNGLFAEVLAGLQRFVAERFGEPIVDAEWRAYEGYPVACFVHGDTTSAAAGALAAFHLHIPVAHVEAGLRTSDILSPYPEELNRQLISRIASFHLAPTYRNEENLVREGVRHGKVFVTGNTAIDALMWAAGLHVPYDAPELADLEDDEETRVVVVTAHRRENWGAGILQVGTAVRQLAQRYPFVRFVVSLHPNPAVADVLRGLLAFETNVSLVQPMGYAAFARVLRRATIAITDSGGIQEEAPTLGTPVIVVRETTERQEGVDAGTLELVGTDLDSIVAAASRLLDDEGERARRAAIVNPYGDGRAAERIVAACEYVAFDAEQPQAFGNGFNRLDILRGAGYYNDPARRVPVPSAAMLVGELSAEDV
ncbi:UDP-N-acetylglucosamine 2-epimerase (non-hydrolyzing) [Planctomonas sp. JC2975]|uniref:non-hydrolyzing UDP-N-acetylglucosamine 2-epimerase n=1 Tax=Planctomonas sp. JC2975 TaxID=2729626 RepID=UPI00147427F3|nr:UDP-N-acetylglucosamine 2-epimerase (non-hydrolyzing) [Planctomonas sp. JC2975]NNC11278.1 UDP-N-acetylglucosamine 2-epimerase (non-hydrolyzing) [Planctomonas sp. JC2975]